VARPTDFFSLLWRHVSEGKGVLEVTEQVILVNERDEITGVEEKIKAHLLGALHRAFSLFVFNADGLLLLQKRASTKYHSKGLWSNTCCGHPRPGESIEQASRRRLWEEMGFRCEIKESFTFIYRAKVDNDLIEHEYDHVMVGNFDGNPNPNGDEVDDWKWVDLMTLKLDMRESPENYTYWFRISLDTLCHSTGPVSTDSQPVLKPLW
jgi:isopentenyl-diphosphate delta-isomerase